MQSDILSVFRQEESRKVIMMETRPVNIRCFSREDGERLEKVLEKARVGRKILRVTRMGSTVYVDLEPTLDEVIHIANIEKAEDKNG